MRSIHRLPCPTGLRPQAPSTEAAAQPVFSSPVSGIGILATVITLFITAKIPSREPKLYDAEIADGKILVGVENPSDASVAAVERALIAGGGRLKTTGFSLG